MIHFSPASRVRAVARLFIRLLYFLRQRYGGDGDECKSKKNALHNSPVALGEGLITARMFQALNFVRDFGALFDVPRRKAAGSCELSL